MSPLKDITSVPNVYISYVYIYIYIFREDISVISLVPYPGLKVTEHTNLMQAMVMILTPVMKTKKQ
jgi:hypothetical protein